MYDSFIHDNYFESIEPIWIDYFKNKISLAERDSRLSGYRAALYREQRLRKREDNSHYQTK